MSDNYEVGYGKPPKKTRWKKGQSGNSEGRPKGVKNMETVVRQEAYSKINVKEGGKTYELTKVEALMKRMMAKGIQGDNKAANIALALMEKYLPHVDPDAAARTPLTEEELKILTNHADFLEVLEDATNDENDT